MLSLRELRRSNQAAGFGKPEHDIHILERRARLPLDKIVDVGDDAQTPAAFINTHNEVAEVCSANLLSTDCGIAKHSSDPVLVPPAVV